MGWSNGIMTAPVGMGDISSALHNTSLDLGTLITSSNSSINKWAMYKPVRFNSWGIISNTNRQSVNCGLVPVSVSEILTKSIGYNGTQSGTKAGGIQQIAEWGYNRPRGISNNEQFRMADFVPESLSGNGYKEAAIAPDGGWTGRDYTAANLSRMTSASVSLNSGSAYTGRNFLMSTYTSGSDYGLFYSGFNMQFGDSSTEGVGDRTNVDIPLKYICDLSAYWRIGLAIWVPAHGSYAEGWALFASNSTISQFFIDHSSATGDIQRDLFPNLCSSPYAASYISTYVSAQGGFARLDVVPLLIKNLTYNYNGQSVGTNFYLRADSSTTAYCMPSGASTIDFTFGTPPAPIYYEWVIDTSTSGMIYYRLRNKSDSTHSYQFGYTIVIYRNGSVSSTVTGTTATLAPGGESGNLAGHPTTTGWGPDQYTVTSQTQV